ncbi:MAG: DNA modification methylase, partial [Phycisphaerales bacterium]|nr:DNA modification methylase [Phycisphaerales bacterium]
MMIRNRIKELRNVSASDLKPSARNWRTHPKAQQDALRGVLAEIGFADAVLARELEDGSLELIDGHLRAETVGDAKVPVLVLDVDEEEAGKLLATLDPLAGMAGADPAKLDELLKQVSFDSDAVAEMLRGMAEAAGLAVAGGTPVVDDEIPEPPAAEDAVTQRGDLWLLDSGSAKAGRGKVKDAGAAVAGGHRLLCGDATDRHEVRRVMDRKRAGLFATDPPYLVGYDGTNHPQSFTGGGSKDWSGSYGNTWDDADGNPDLYDKFVGAAIAEALTENAAWCCWHASRRQAMLESVWNKHGAFVHCQLVWGKNRPVLTRTWYMWQHEPCLMGWLKGKKPPKGPEAKPTSTLWMIDTIPNGDERPDQGHTAGRARNHDMSHRFMQRSVRNYLKSLFRADDTSRSRMTGRRPGWPARSIVEGGRVRWTPSG